MPAEGIANAIEEAAGLGGATGAMVWNLTWVNQACAWRREGEASLAERPVCYSAMSRIR